MDPLQIAGAITAGGAALGLVWAGGRFVWRMGRNVSSLADDWKGEPARPGVEARPGVLERLTALEVSQRAVIKELHPNGGSSMRDSLTRVETRVDGLVTQLAAAQPVQVNVGMPTNTTT